MQYSFRKLFENSLFSTSKYMYFIYFANFQVQNIQYRTERSPDASRQFANPSSRVQCSVFSPNSQFHQKNIKKTNEIFIHLLQYMLLNWGRPWLALFIDQSHIITIIHPLETHFGQLIPITEYYLFNTSQYLRSTGKNIQTQK